MPWALTNYPTCTVTLRDCAVPTTAAFMPMLSLKIHSAVGETMYFSDTYNASDAI